jgi:hypothetical protein
MLRDNAPVHPPARTADPNNKFLRFIYASADRAQESAPRDFGTSARKLDGADVTRRVSRLLAREGAFIGAVTN